MPYLRMDIHATDIQIEGNDSVVVFERFDRNGTLRKRSFVYRNAFDRNRRLMGVRGFVYGIS